ncbi:hypothetical protein WM16_31625 [Burkholderia ubonensis]|uniref:LysM domain-containing protein n=1 Tax=Burkholderia ubonensis TaxID=101571 RepID=A0A119UZP8_9BURK|nr:LysM peptidoglycan-binding domain-containing protein [Burkholderia ubonensis]KWK83877.1 hypothetical protein WM16_31625 [Burkholderia ubonensis]
MFVRATYDRENKTVHYFDADGNETLYIGGSFAWRTTNPGNLTKPGSYVMESAIGYAQRTSNPKSRFVIFSDREAGKRAHQKLLKEIYGDKTIRGMITIYAPPSENDTEKYIAFVKGKAGVSDKDVVGALSREKFEAVVAAMEQQEGWVPGVIKHLGKPVQVQMLDKMNQPFAKQAMQVKGSGGSVDVRTDASGTLPWIYSGLLGQDLTILYNREHGQFEHVGTISAESQARAYTINAPYSLLSTRPWLHATDEPERPRVHIVQAGETLSRIAAKYGTTVDAFVHANGLADPNHVYARQHLNIPPADGASGPGNPAASSPSSAPTPKPKAESSPVTSPGTATAGASKPHPGSVGTPAAGQKGATAASSPAKDAPVPAGKPPAASSSGHAAPEAAKTQSGSATGAAPSGPRHVPAAPHPAAANGASNQAAGGVVHQRTPNGHPQTVVSSPNLELSGRKWCEKYPGSKSVDSLNADFKAKVSAFFAVLKEAKIHYAVNAAFRPNERSYMMYHAFQIAKKKESPDKVAPWPGVNIDWVHRKPDGSMDLDASIKAAKEMCAGFGIKVDDPKQRVGRPKSSRHNFGGAVDINISGYANKKVKNADGHEVELKSFKDLVSLGASYGVHYFPAERMHWSDTGH